jgi:hypothetical protein
VDFPLPLRDAFGGGVCVYISTYIHAGRGNESNDEDDIGDRVEGGRVYSERVDVDKFRESE